ncbi:MAG: class I SAM-dependent methyltransferase [Bacteriovoracaceae bacterium]
MSDITQRDGERLIAENIDTKGEYLAFLKHLFAYDYLKEFSRTDGKALEVGFGSGYGTEYASRFFQKVDAVEVDKEAIDYANRKYQLSNVTFQNYDGSRLPFSDNNFDVVYSFQVIEHVPFDKEFLLEAKRVLRPGGKLIITTPNRLYRLKDGQKPLNRFHLREYSPSQLKQLLTSCFDQFILQGVKGVGEVHQYEIDRVKKGLGKWDPFRIRDHIPENLKKPLRNVINSLRGKYNHNLEKDLSFKDKYSLKDYYIEKDDINSTLDLMAICSK